MHIRKLEVVGFHGLQDFTLDFPDKGTVIVTGANGTGKSTILEAACWAMWGKTLRGTTPGGDGATVCSVALTTSDVYVCRARENGRTKMGWSYNKAGTLEPSEDFPTMRAAQEALESIVGDFGLWVRSKIFSSSDAVYFSMASDKERKRLLEEVLGVDRFDSAYALCRKDLSTGVGNAQKLEQGAAILSERIDGISARLEDYENYAGSTSVGSPDAGALKETLSKLNTQKAAAAEDESAQNAFVNKCRKEVIQLNSAIGFEQRKLSALDVSDCPTCFQKIDDAHKESVQSAVSKAIEDIKARLESKKGDLSGLVDTLSELTEESALVSRACYETDSKLRTALAALKTDADIEKNKLQLVHSKAEHEKEAATLNDEKSELDKSIDILNLVADVLNTRGVRAQVIGNALTGLQLAANTWLSKLCNDLQIELSSATTQASGKVVDAISLGIAGAGGGKGYKALSSGQRRRVDVALMLGLGAIAEASSGRRGSMLFDEVFDALDTDGVASIVGVLSELSQDRMVMVVTHNNELATAIPAALKLTTPF